MFDKIRKLLAMADHPNTNPSEAANAAAMAAALAAKHNIDLDAARAASGEAKQFVDPPPFAAVKWRRRDDSGVLIMTRWIGNIFGCTTLYHRNGDTRWVSFQGQAHNVMLCESWFEYLWKACKRANTEHARSEARGSFDARENARAMFRLHFCTAVATRLRERYNAMRTTDVVSGSTALVVSAWFDAERREVAEWMANRHPDLKDFVPRMPTARDDAAARAGNDAGRRVSLADQIAATPRSTAGAIR